MKQMVMVGEDVVVVMKWLTSPMMTDIAWSVISMEHLEVEILDAGEDEFWNQKHLRMFAREEEMLANSTIEQNEKIADFIEANGFGKARKEMYSWV